MNCHMKQNPSCQSVLFLVIVPGINLCESLLHARLKPAYDVECVENGPGSVIRYTRSNAPFPRIRDVHMLQNSVMHMGNQRRRRGWGRNTPGNIACGDGFWGSPKINCAAWTRGSLSVILMIAGLFLQT